VLKALLARHWDSLILDECHYGKSNDAWRTKAIYGMRCDGANGLVSVADRVWLLSGTPMPNNPSELWTHCNALFPDVSQGFGFNRFVDEYCVKDPFSGRIVRSKNREKLAALLKPHVLRRLAKDVLPQLPPLRFSHIPVYPDKLPPMSSELKETAAVVKAAMEAMGTGPEAAQRSRAQLAKLDQGSIASLRKWTGTAKAPAIVEYVKNDLASGMDRVVIFAWHREPIRIIEEGIKGAVAIHGDVSAKRREEILKEFKHGSSIPALVLQTEIGSTAINLVNAANVVFAEPSWVPKDIEQAAARLHRQGQLRPVWARLFSLQGSFDETVIRVLTRKMAFTKAFNTSITAHPA
jgi:SNF2 family DNA or RNA helicase